MGDCRHLDQTFGTDKKALPAPFVERRARVRFRCERLCRTRTFITNTYRTVPARLVDFSLSGAGLILHEPLPVGLRANLEIDEEGSEVPLEMLVEIANVAAQDDGSWRCGCVLVWRISEDEMWALLKTAGADGIPSAIAKHDATQAHVTE
jgi:hypothetical protein